MEEFKFRKAEKIDIEQLVDMRIEYLKEDLGEVAIYDEVQLRKNLQLFFEEHLNNDIDAFVALCGNEIVSTSFTSYYFRLFQCVGNRNAPLYLQVSEDGRNVYLVNSDTCYDVSWLESKVESFQYTDKNFGVSAHIEIF